MYELDNYAQMMNSDAELDPELEEVDEHEYNKIRREEEKAEQNADFQRENDLCE
jgi:hypothetical protein